MDRNENVKVVISHESDPEDDSCYKSKECCKHILIKIYPGYESDPEYDSCYKSNECWNHMLMYIT